MSVSPAGFVAQTEGEVAPAAAGTPKTFLNVIAAANRRFMITELGIGFVGVTAAAKPVLVELVSSTQATAGTSSAVTPRAIVVSNASTVQSTAAKTYTVEPTVLTPVREWLVHPQAPLVVQFPLGREAISAIAGGLALRVTFATGETTVNGRAYIEFEE